MTQFQFDKNPGIQELQALSHDVKYNFKKVDPKLLETFINPANHQSYVVKLKTDELTYLCAKTDQPMFANLYIDYRPDLKCIEIRSLIAYVASFRMKRALIEYVVNRILSDLSKALDPKGIKVTCVQQEGGSTIQAQATAGQQL